METIVSYFANPILQVSLDLNSELLTEFALQIQNQDKDGEHETNIGGWQSKDISEEKHKEFIKLKKEINKYLQVYHLETFKEVVFKEDTIQSLSRMWVNINKEHSYNEWHTHPFSTFSGVYYIKHDGFIESGDILFKNPKALSMEGVHWPQGLMETPNVITAGYINITPKSNMLILFPSWLEHKVEINRKKNSRISLSFNSLITPKRTE